MLSQFLLGWVSGLPSHSAWLRKSEVFTGRAAADRPPNVQGFFWACGLNEESFMVVPEDLLVLPLKACRTKARSRLRSISVPP